MSDAALTINLIRATAADLQAQLQNGDLTSEHLVQLYLRQMQQHEPRLNALISIAPSHIILERARILDKERAKGTTRGPLHGIPIILKDVILTSRSLGMPTTAGSHALLQTSGLVNADVVDKLLAAGLIILAKANLSETWGPKGLPYMLPGWSAVGGQTQSVYVKNGLDPDDVILGNSSPLGSSTGCAVAVSAGYAPLAVGEETSGSLVAPANRAGLYALKTTPSSIDMKGVFPISKTFDTLGPMAKCPKDV
jgi:amidase